MVEEKYFILLPKYMYNSLVTVFVSQLFEKMLSLFFVQGCIKWENNWNIKESTDQIELESMTIRVFCTNQLVHFHGKILLNVGFLKNCAIFEKKLQPPCSHPPFKSYMLKVIRLTQGLNGLKMIYLTFKGDLESVIIG